MKYFIIALALLYTTMGNAQCLKLDLIVVGDLSGSTSYYQQEIQLAFKSFVDRFVLGENTANIGFVVFGEQAGVVTGLTHDKQKLYNGIGTMFSYPVGIFTNIGKGLVTSYNELQVNGRDDAKKIIILISDGYENVDMKITKQYINTIKNDSNIKMCGVLINSDAASPDFMMELSDEFCYVTTDYYHLQDTLERMTLCF